MRRFAIPFIVLCTILCGCGTEPTPVYTITTEVEPSEAGSVSPSSATFDEGTEAEFTATANEHWVFSGWEGRSTSDNPLTITVTSDGSVTALFEKMEYPLNTDVSGSGRILQEVLQSISDYDHGTTVQLTADPFDHWSFVEWTGDLTGSENPVTIEIDGEKSVTAVFEKSEFTISTDVTGEGSISLTPEKEYYDRDESIEILAEPDDGKKFDGWSGDLEGNENPLTVSIDSDMSIGATFSVIKYTLEVGTNGNGEVEVDPSQDEYEHGEEISIEADSDPGWSFIGWTGDITSNENPYSFNISENIEAVANFEECTDPDDCISTDFYASTIINNVIFGSSLRFLNNLSSDVLLKSLVIKRGDGSITGQKSSIDKVLGPGENAGYNATYSPQPTLDQFLEFTVEWTYEHQGVESIIITKARGFSF